MTGTSGLKPDPAAPKGEDRETIDAAIDVAERLAGAPVLSLERLGGGRNSRVFCVETTGARYALKQYPSRADDMRDRLGTEVAALKLMESQGFDTVPRVVAADRERNFALLTWAEGDLVHDVRASDVDQALSFLSRLHGLRGTSAFPHTCLATEACLSGAEIERQIGVRIVSLRSLAGESELYAFLDGEFSAHFDQLFAEAKLKLGRAGLSFQGELPQADRSLVPSDFGFHNTLRDPGGRLTFIDFEYFGWDDPVKLTADIVHHPGTPVTRNLRQRIRHGAETFYATDPNFALRLDAFLPLFGLRWVIILLNEFHPERWRKRVQAGMVENWSEVKERQLAAARLLLSEIAS